MNWRNSIGMKIILSVVGMILVVNGALAWLFLDIQRRNLDHALLRTASQLSETIKKSIQNDMLENRKEAAYKIMETIGRQEGIEKVRVYSSEGKILFSSDNTGELGRMVNKKAEACYGCHSEARPLVRLATSERSRIFFSRDHEITHTANHRVLGIINPMYNDPGCSEAACHAHPAFQKVLGVIDVTMDLGEVDRQITAARRQVLIVTIVSGVAIFAVVTLILFYFLERPVKELVLGTKRISGGDLGHFIDVTSNDEMGHLAASFNMMTLNLQNAQKEIREGIRNLEQKVQERTRELKSTQSQLIHSEKLAAVGALAATVAHEINNPLTGVYTYIRLMERKIEQGQYGPEEIAKYKGYLDTMRREVERTTAIVQNLLDFTRPKDPVRKPMDLIKVMEESLALISNKLSLSNIQVVKNLNPLPEVHADPAHMKQVFLNLLINACEAMEEGGTLTIRSEHHPETNTVTMSVRDTGTGIEEKDRARIFDPFFSTKKKGTGLGLSVVNGIVARHNGRIEIDSAPGKGTLFLVNLPVG